MERAQTMVPQNGLIVRWIVTAQIALSLLAAAVGGLLGGLTTAWMVLVGGGIAVGLTLLFAWRAFAAGGDDPKTMLGALYRAEAARLIAATLIFIAVALRVPHHFLAIVAGYGAATLSFWLALPLTARYLAAADVAAGNLEHRASGTTNRDETK